MVFKASTILLLFLKKKTIPVVLMGFLLSFAFISSQDFAFGQTIGIFDDCDALANVYGSWSTTVGTLGIGSNSPAQGSGYISDSVTGSYNAFLNKACYESNYWNFVSTVNA